MAPSRNHQEEQDVARRSRNVKLQCSSASEPLTLRLREAEAEGDWATVLEVMTEVKVSGWRFVHDGFMAVSRPFIAMMIMFPC